MSEKPSPRAQVADIKKNGFSRGESAGSRCESCERSAGRGWWVRVSFEYNEWSCYCRECAYDRVHQYDDLTPADLDTMFGGEQ
jgi:hypothetical protein